MRITLYNNMVTIETEDLWYVNIDGMYETGPGHGLQVSKRLEHEYNPLLKACGKVAKAVYELQRELEPPLSL